MGRGLAVTGETKVGSTFGPAVKVVFAPSSWRYRLSTEILASTIKSWCEVRG